MSYSLDLRHRVVLYVKDGGTKISASRHFKVSLWCVNDWCSRDNLEPIKPSGRPRKIAWKPLAADIQKHPDKLLRERAKEFGVRINAIWYVCQKLKISHKKTLRYAERDHMSRIKYLRSLRTVIKEKGSKDVIFVDESGFESHTYRPYAWNTKGCKSFGERSGKRGGRTNLIAGKRGKELLATVLYETSTTADWFNEWFENHLLKELRPTSTIIMDNAAFSYANLRFTKKQSLQK